MKHQDYLLKMKVGNAVRTVKWNGADALDLDHPTGWVLEPTETGFRLYDGTEKNPEAQHQTSVVVDKSSWLDHLHIELPGTSRGPQNRHMSVDLHRLHPMRAAYSTVPTSGAIATNKPRQLFMFYGLRYFMVHYRPIGSRFVATIGDNKVFAYEKVSDGYKITPIREAIKLKVPKERKRTLNVGQSYVLPESSFFNATFLLSVHWWRFQAVPTPDALPPIETEETVEDEREQERLRKAIQAFMVAFVMLTVGMYVFSKRGPKIVAQTKIELKQPKIIPVKEPPKLVEKKIEPPKPKPKEPEPPKKIVEPKKKPIEKKVVVKPPKPVKPKKVAQAAKLPTPAPPKPLPKAPPAPPPVVKSPLPPAAGLVAKKPPPAPPPPDPNKQLAQSLSFLGTSSSKPAAQVPTNYKDKSNTKYDPKAVAVGGGSPNSKLESMMAVSTDTNIETQSARTIAGNVKFGGKGGGKELNNVQGKVDSKDLYDPNAKFSMESGSLSVSGPGSADESEIERALSKFMAKFQYCYEKALLSNPNLGGNIVYKWTIQTSGKASNAKVVKSQMNDSNLQSCITGVLQQVPFPKPKGGVVEVTKTFTFSSATL